MDLTSIALATPTKPAVILAESGKITTYAAFADTVGRIETLFDDLGLVPGEGVAILARNSDTYLAFVCAAFRRGLRYTTLGTHLKPLEIAFIVGDSGARVMLADLEHLDTADEALAAGPNAISHRFALGAVLAEGWRDLGSAISAVTLRALEPTPEGADFLYSSGTTGKPKGIRLELAASPVSLIDPFPGGDQAVELFPAPLAFSAPLRSSMIRIKSGGTVVFMGKFEPRSFLDTIQKYRVTHLSVVPTMFVRLLSIPEDERRNWDLTSVKVISHSGGPCAVGVKQAIIDWFGPVVYEGYSGTEYVGGTSIDSLEWLENPGSVGHAARNGVKVLREDGSEAAVDEVGRVYFVNARKFDYHNDPAKTAQMYRADGSATLGDLGYVNERGFLFLTDRAAFTIVSGGVNIYPQEIEDILSLHPGVEDVAVFGVPNEEFGEEVKAVVVLKAAWVGNAADAERALLDFARERLSSLKLPKSIDIRQSLPRNDAGKLLKQSIKDEYWARAR